MPLDGRKQPVDTDAVRVMVLAGSTVFGIKQDRHRFITTDHELGAQMVAQGVAVTTIRAAQMGLRP